MRLAATFLLWLLPSVAFACEAITSGSGLPGRSTEVSFSNAAPNGSRHENWAPRSAELVMHAGFEALTDDYGHAIMGGLRDAKALAIHLRLPGDTRQTCPKGVILPDDEVFEDIAPRLVDMTGDGRPEVLVVQSNTDLGAKLAIYDRWGALVAATPNIGTRFRWLAPVGAADFNGDGAMDVAFVDRPHLAKMLRVWTLKSGQLSEIATLGGVTNHAIGEEFIASAVRTCGGLPEIILTDARRRSVLGVRFKGGALTTRTIGTYSGPETLTTAARC